MDKKIFKMALAASFAALLFCGCQKEPESSSDGGIRHAKSSAESKVADIVKDRAGSPISREAKEINTLVGTKESGVNVKASYPHIPEHVYHMVLEKNSALKGELLQNFLEGDSGKIRDISDERKREAEQMEKENKNSEEKAVYAVFGDTSLCTITDGRKEAGFVHGTGGYYEDMDLKRKCDAIYKSGEETILSICKPGKAAGLADAEDETAGGSAGFSLGEAESMLLAKLSKIDLSEIMVYEAAMYQGGDFMFYELKFTSSYEGMGIVHEVGSVSEGEVYPSGYAWVCADGVAAIDLTECLGRVKQKEECEKLLSWEQIEEIITVNLHDGKIHGSSEVVMTEVEFLYYPSFDESKNEISLIPVWQIYIPMSAWIEDDKLSKEIGTNGAASNICVNAVSGEIMRME